MSERLRICIPWPRRPPSTGQGGSAGCRPPRQSQRRNAGGTVLRRHVCGGPSRFIIMQLGGSGAGLGWCAGGTAHNLTRAAIAEGASFVRVPEFAHLSAQISYEALNQNANRYPVSIAARHASNAIWESLKCLYRIKVKSTWTGASQTKPSLRRYGRGMPPRTLRELCASRSRLRAIGSRRKFLSDVVPN